MRGFNRIIICINIVSTISSTIAWRLIKRFYGIDSFKILSYE